jgi:hypothetical protein
MKFRNAILISIVAHFALITPLYSIDLSKDAPDENRPMVVDYVSVKETPSVTVEKVAMSKLQEPKRIVLAKEVTSNPTSGSKKPSTQDQKKALQEKALPNGYMNKMATAKEQERIEAKIKTTKDYVNYYQLIREKIKQKLKENYKYYNNEGDAYLVFTLRSDGALLAHDLLPDRSSPDQTLRHIATVSLIEAAPFPEFPKALAVQKLSFNVVVSFKKQ